MQRHVHILFPLLILFVATLSCTPRSVRDRLATAEAVMETDPDSAHAIIMSVDRADLRTDHYRALHALLRARAADKLHLPLAGDTLLPEAVSHFDISSSTRHAMMARYCYGRQLTEEGRLIPALSSMLHAYRHANSLSDPFWQGLTARGIADIYASTYNTADRLQFARQELDNFEKSGRQPFVNYAMIDLAHALVGNGQLDEVLVISQKALDSAAVHCDSALRYEALSVRGLAYFGKNSTRDAIHCYEDACRSGYAVEDDSMRLALLYVEDGQIEKGKSIFFSLGDASPLVRERFNAELSMKNGKYEDAAWAMFRYDSVSDALLRKRTEVNLMRGVGDYQDASISRLESRLDDERDRLTIAVVAFLLLIVAGCLAGMYYRKERRRMTETYLSAFEELSVTRDNSVNRLLSRHLEPLDHLCSRSYDIDAHEFSEARIVKTFKSLVKEYSYGGAKLNELEELVNLNHDGIISSLREDFPDFKEKDFRLFLFSMLGLSASTVSLLMGEKSSMAIYNRRKRLKEKIAQSSSPRSVRYLELLSARR